MLFSIGLRAGKTKVKKFKALKYKEIKMKIVTNLLIILSFLYLASSVKAQQPEVVERSWPDYFKEHKKNFEPKTVKIEGSPIWAIVNPDDWAANTTVIEGEDRLISL